MPDEKKRKKLYYRSFGRDVQFTHHSNRFYPLPIDCDRSTDGFEVERKHVAVVSPLVYVAPLRSVDSMNSISIGRILNV